MIKWPKVFEPIINFDRRLLDSLNLDNLTKDFLVNTGLPKNCAPFLSFVENNDIQYKGMLPITKYYDFLESEYSRYIVIGSDGCGNNIVIDTFSFCEIVLLDHENNFTRSYINKSVYHLFNSLVRYENFVEDVLTVFGDSGLLDFKYSDSQIRALECHLIENDPESINDQCFWNQEINILVANKSSK
jgi:hypothetical protein